MQVSLLVVSHCQTFLHSVLTTWNRRDWFEGKMSQKATARTSSLMALHSDSHKQSILSKFDKLRKRDLLCDITLVVEDVHFKAHKALLAASSEYFSLMFMAEDQISQSTYRLDGMAAAMFAEVLEFIYSAQVSVEESATEQLLATAHVMEVNDLVKVLNELTHSAAVVRGQEVKADITQVPDQPKRKRGRPKKKELVTELEGTSAPCDSSEGGLVGDTDCDDTVTESQAKDNADYKPEAHQSRQSKRKIRPPVKYKSYKVVSDTAVSKEPGKKGRKRKYPNTEARCEDCGKVFKNHLFLKIHQRTHTGEKPFQCLVCGKGFTQKHTLLVHQRMHTGEKPFVCTVCSKALSTNHSLQEHMNLHKGEKPYDCSICNKSFSDPSARRRHVASHSGKKPFTCSSCGLSFTRLDNLNTHTKSHNKERAVTTKATSDAPRAAEPPEEEVHDILQLQPYQLPSTSEQEIQLVVTGDVDNINFGPGQNQEISIITTEGEAAESSHSRLTLLTQSPGNVQNVALVAQSGVADQSPQIQTIGLLQGQMSHQPEQMHVLTLSKEAMEQLQAEHGAPHTLQIAQRAVQQLQVMHQPIQQLAVGQVGREHTHSQAIHISSQSSQPISISQTSEQISSHHIQGQTFQIQAGTVSYLYTTGLPQES
ncbi:zinc finger and BTB domain-containing protein 24 [Perca fluviatilis]|uniref:zinc finger and BTB domain-containing protein 24 n=1 Tax=Perca fluviatilis TaxID=8168 RepID=UPI001962383F|nr:zinc finger and BTB domain-containing protein 24 [Perca fluviatilis]